MRKVLLAILIVSAFFFPVSAMSFDAPTVPQSGAELMPETESFGEGLWYIIKTAVGKLKPEIPQAAGVCISIVAIVILTSIADQFSENLQHIINVASVVIISTLLLGKTHSMVTLGTDTVTQMSEYGKLLMPVMTAAMAAQGGVTSSASIYAATMLFDSLLTGIIIKVLVPLIYVYICFSVAGRATSQSALIKLQDTSKKSASWILKTILFIFTAYLTITGVVSGSTDAATLKAAKLTISGAVPVIGSMLSDASEAVLVGAGVLKNTAGIYGLFAVLSVCISPFLKIGLQYILLKATATLCDVVGRKETTSIIHDFAGAMGVILAMVASLCVILMISTICFMRGIGV